MNLQSEFNRQIQHLIDIGYPEAAGITIKEFFNLTNPLVKKLSKIEIVDFNLENGTLPFVVVVKNSLISISKMMGMITKDKKVGIVKLSPLEPQDFQPVDDVSIPTNPVYLLIDIDRGKDNINLPPIEAMIKIKEKGRSPLTIEEGIAIVTQFPEFLIKNNCFSLLASRHKGDKRVPAIWINGSKNPNLGWCWNGNPHTWLGSASCIKRVA